MIRLFVHLAGLSPALWILGKYYMIGLGADPQEVLLHYSGLWSLKILIVTLAISPIAQVTQIKSLIRYRRAIGLYSFFYLCIHVMCFTVFFVFLDWELFLEELYLRTYILLGMVAFCILFLLTITSNRFSQRLLKKKWKKLHHFIYFAVLLAGTHFIWQSKSDLNVPVLYMIVIVSLLFWRVPAVKQLILSQKASVLNNK